MKQVYRKMPSPKAPIESPVSVYLPGEAGTIAICAVAEKAMDLAMAVISKQTDEQAVRLWELHIKSLERWEKIWDAMFNVQRQAGKE